MRRAALLASLCTLGLAACAEERAPEAPGVVNAVDPYIARALNDPLMVDPDLAYRNEANAAITIGYDHALPSFRASEETESAARETARLALLEGGRIPDLPAGVGEPGPVSLAEEYSVEAVLEAVDAPAACRRGIRGNFALAAAMPDVAPVMPHGMVRVAAGVDQPGCTLRLVRYVTPALVEDALQHHYAMAIRTGMDPTVYAEPEASLFGDRRGTFLRVFARKTSGDLTAVDVITWSR